MSLTKRTMKTTLIKMGRVVVNLKAMVILRKAMMRKMTIMMTIVMTTMMTMTMKIATVKAMKAGVKVKKKRILTKTTKFANKNLIKYTFTSFRLYQLY